MHEFSVAGLLAQIVVAAAAIVLLILGRRRTRAEARRAQNEDTNGARTERVG